MQEGADFVPPIFTNTDHLMYRAVTLTCTLLLMIVAAGCAGLGKNKAPHPVAGQWDWSVDTPQGTYTGVLTFTEMDDVLSGTISNAGQEDTSPLEDLVYNEGVVTFKFDSGEFGMLHVNVTLDGDNMNGTMDVPMYDARGMAFTATRLAPAS